MKNILILLLLAMCGCHKAETTPDIWRVVGIDEQHHFALIHTNYAQHEQTRYSLVCGYYKWGRHEMVKGPTACALNVGQVIVPQVVADKPEEFVAVLPSDNFLTITEGAGEDE